MPGALAATGSFLLLTFCCFSNMVYNVHYGGITVNSFGMRISVMKHQVEPFSCQGMTTEGGIGPRK